MNNAGRMLSVPSFAEVAPSGDELLRWNGLYTYAILLIKDIAAGK